jgi:hypothetical protein
MFLRKQLPLSRARGRYFVGGCGGFSAASRAAVSMATFASVAP